MVFRHDASNILRDVTDGIFLHMEKLVLVKGELRRGSYFTAVDRARTIVCRSEKQKSTKVSLKKVTGDIDCIGQGVSLGIKEPSVKDNEVLRNIMACIIV